MEKNGLDKIECILFDFDGTISDSNDAALETYNLISEKYGFKHVEASEIGFLKHKSSKELLKYLGISLLKLPFVIRDARDKFQKKIDHLKPFAALPEVLVELRERGFELGVLTSNSGKNVKKFLKNNRIDVFEHVYSSVSVFGKSRAIKKLMKRAKLVSQKVAYVGDETRDIEAAKSAGVNVISVSWGFNSREVLEAHQPDRVIDKPGDLLDLFHIRS